MRGATILALMQGFFYVQESKGDLTRDHYLSSFPPIESLVMEFLLTRKIPRCSRTGTRTRVAELRGKDESTELSDHPLRCLVSSDIPQIYRPPKSKKSGGAKWGTPCS